MERKNHHNEKHGVGPSHHHYKEGAHNKHAGAPHEKDVKHASAPHHAHPGANVNAPHQNPPSKKW